MTELENDLLPFDDPGEGVVINYERCQWGIQYFALFAERMNRWIDSERGDSYGMGPWRLGRDQDIFGYDSLFGEPRMELSHPLSYRGESVGYVKIIPFSIASQGKRFSPAAVKVEISDPLKIPFSHIKRFAMCTASFFLFSAKGKKRGNCRTEFALAVGKALWEDRRNSLCLHEFDFEYIGHVDPNDLWLSGK